MVSIDHLVAMTPPDTNRLDEFNRRLGATSSTLVRLRSDLDTVTDQAKPLGVVDIVKLRTDADSTSTHVDHLQHDFDNLSPTVAELDKRVVKAENNFLTGLNQFKSDLAVTNSTLTDLRDIGYERLQNSHGRNPFIHPTQIFKSDRYMLTAQSFRALQSLMCKEQCPEKSKTDIGGASQSNAVAKDRAASAQPIPTPPCRSVSYSEECSDVKMSPFLKALSTMIGSPPQSEDDFLKPLEGFKKGLLKDWKHLILKYTRVTY
jgi:hypothetical protein